MDLLFFFLCESIDCGRVLFYEPGLIGLMQSLHTLRTGMSYSSEDQTRSAVGWDLPGCFRSIQERGIMSYVWRGGTPEGLLSKAGNNVGNLGDSVQPTH